MERALLHFVLAGITSGIFFGLLRDHWKYLVPFWLLCLAHFFLTAQGRKMSQREAERALEKPKKERTPEKKP